MTMTMADPTLSCEGYMPLEDGETLSTIDDAETVSTVDSLNSSFESTDNKRGKASAFSICVNLVMSGLGAGILSLPWALAGASILPSVATIVIVMALNVGTIMILVLAAEEHQAFDLGALLAHLPGRVGPFMQIFNNVLTWLSVLLSLTGYIVVIADSMQPIAVSAFGLDATSFWSVRAPLLVASGVIVLPICFIDQRRLAVSSVVGICVTIYLFIVVAVLFARRGVAPECCLASGVHEGTLTMFSTLMQCAIVQMCILPMYEEMENRTPRRFGGAVVAAFSFLALLFAAFSTVAYSVFGPTVSSNVMMDLPDDILGSIARVGMMLVMLAVFPIMMLSMTTPVRHWEEARGGTSGHITAAVSVGIVAVSSLGAAFVGKLGALNAINGAAQVCFFIGLGPGLAGLYLLNRSSSIWRAAMYVLVTASIVASVLGSIYTDNAVDELTEACLWST